MRVDKTERDGASCLFATFRTSILFDIQQRLMMVLMIYSFSIIKVERLEKNLK